MNLGGHAPPVPGNDQLDFHKCVLYSKFNKPSSQQSVEAKKKKNPSFLLSSLPSSFLVSRSYFQKQFQVHCRSEQKGGRFSTYPPFPCLHSLPMVSISYCSNDTLQLTGLLYVQQSRCILCGFDTFMTGIHCYNTQSVSYITVEALSSFDKNEQFPEGSRHILN